MVECELLDRLSILTYLAQFYQAFNSQAVQSRVRVLGGQGSVSKSSSVNSDLTDAAGGKTKLNPKIGRLTDPCRQCGKSVFVSFTTKWFLCFSWPKGSALLSGNVTKLTE